MKPISCLLVGLIFAGCIGTDYVDDPVAPSPAARLVIAPASAVLQPTESLQLDASVIESGGNGVPASGVSWSSSDPNIVTVDATGLATANATGQARIIARAGLLMSDAALVTVVTDQNQVARVEVAPQTVQSAPGETRQFTATAYNLNNQIISGRPVSWTSSNTEVVTISGGGLATAQSIGTASITATIDNVESLPATFTVSTTSRTGTFVMRPGSGHDVRGTATLTEQSNGRLVLAFGSDFASAGGPDVRVYLSTSNSLNSGSTDLGRLQSFSGAQSYSVPSNIQLNTYDWVIIHCVPFNITFGYARLQ